MCIVDDRVTLCARNVRRWMVRNRTSVRVSGRTPNRTLRGLCAIGSTRLLEQLRRRSIKCCLVMYEQPPEEGSFAHVFVLVEDAWIVDVTATQLSPKCKAVEILHKDHALHRRPEWDLKARCRYFYSCRQMVKYQKSTHWPQDQTPFI